MKLEKRSIKGEIFERVLTTAHALAPFLLIWAKLERVPMGRTRLVTAWSPRTVEACIRALPDALGRLTGLLINLAQKLCGRCSRVLGWFVHPIYDFDDELPVSGFVGLKDLT